MNKEQILKNMADEMPFELPERIVPYILEAMEIYKNQPTKSAGELELFAVWLDHKRNNLDDQDFDVLMPTELLTLYRQQK